MKKIQVLMSTYNGEKYIKEQIDSIISQKGVEVHILVRDDGSKDSTVEILRGYEGIEIIEANNVGATNSFLELLKLAGDYEYYAFSDQDDVWDEDKLEIAVQRLKEYKCPAIYSGNTRLVDGDLKLIKVETLKPVTTLESAIVKNYATGCTIVLNDELMNYLKQRTPKSAPFHDWWANLVCLAVGGVSVYDYEPHMQYRQHCNNVVSGNDSSLKKWKSRFCKFMNSYQYHRENIANEILEFYNCDVTDESRTTLELIMDYRRKHISFLLSNKFKTSSCVDNILFYVCSLFDKI